MKTGKKIIVLMVLVFVLMPVFAHAVSWWPLVPCGTSVNPAPCNRCDLLKLFKNIIDFTLVGLMPPLAAILFVWGGFLILMGGANPGLITKGRTIFFNTAIGVAIISASWLITNTIIRSVAADNVAPEWWKLECSVPVSPTQKYSCDSNQCIESATGTYTEATCNNSCGVIVPPTQKYSCDSNDQCIVDPRGTDPNNDCSGKCKAPPGGVLSITTPSLPNATQGVAYSQNLSATGGTAPYTWALFTTTSSTGVLPAGLVLTVDGEIKGTPTATGNFTFKVQVNDSIGEVTATKQLSIVVTGTSTSTCGASWETNLCQPRSMTCGASACSQYVGAINQYAGGAASANFLKAIMIKESTCNVAADSGQAYGLMQLKPSTANVYKSRCGVSTDITSTWLKTSANASASICIAAEYIKALSSTSCGNTPRNIAAGYNGGSGACANSVSCAGGRSCDNSATKKWECLYDDTANSVCNTGYDETRDYATKVLYCYNNPGF